MCMGQEYTIFPGVGQTTNKASWKIFILKTIVIVVFWRKNRLFVSGVLVGVY